MNESEHIEQLKSKRFDPVYVWNAEPNEEDLEHTHRFDTKLVILDGEITIGMDGGSSILKAGDVIEIPKDKLHSGLAGPTGCKYIVAEKHY